MQLIFLLGCCGMAISQLNCDSLLRNIYPQWFTHCDCSYSQWSEWQFVPDSVVDVPTSQCSTGQAYSESRTRSAVGQGCISETETRVICLPDQEDMLIDALGLGTAPPAPTIPTTTEPPVTTTELPFTEFEDPIGTLVPHIVQRQASLNRCPGGTGQTGLICTDAPYNTGKRSIHREFRPAKRSSEIKEPAHLPEDPIPYDRKEHGARFRRTLCQPNGDQYILFLLDISGSIGSADFTRATTAVSKLVAIFCRPPRIGVMTFDHQFNLEFCFDCFGTDGAGRSQAAQAIQNIPYRGGLTYTGGATRCACDELLTPGCGMHPFATCTDVVYITDGKSNDPTLQVCDEVKCLHNHLNGVNTYAIGIGNNVDQAEIDCIAQSSDTFSTFRFDDFTVFEDTIENIIQRLTVNSTQYTCTNSDGTLGN